MTTPAQGDLDFEHHPPEPEWETHQAVAEKLQAARDRLKEQLAPLVNELLRDRGATGITVDEVRRMAETRGWLTGEESGRYLSFLSGFLKGLGAVPQGFHTSDHPNSNGRKVRVWVLAEYSIAVGDLPGHERAHFKPGGAVAGLVEAVENIRRKLLPLHRALTPTESAIEQACDDALDTFRRQVAAYHEDV